MNFRITLFLFLFLFVFNGMAFSQESPIVTIIPAEQVAIVKGQTVQLSVRAKIKQGFHVQANPASDEFLIPTTLTVDAGKDIVPGEPVYPGGHPYRLKGSTDDLLTYEDEVLISLPVKVMDSAPAGTTSITGKLRFQSCDDRRCFPPRSISVEIPVKIVDPQK
jgi:DsbC/DsbD-like thiol-disulfide interchange protein